MAHFKSKPRRVLAYGIRSVGKITGKKGSYKARVILETGQEVQFEGRFKPRAGDMCITEILSQGLRDVPVFMEYEDFNTEFYRH